MVAGRSALFMGCPCFSGCSHKQPSRQEVHIPQVSALISNTDHAPIRRKHMHVVHRERGEREPKKKKEFPSLKVCSNTPHIFHKERKIYKKKEDSLRHVPKQERGVFVPPRCSRGSRLASNATVGVHLLSWFISEIIWLFH